MNARTAFSIRCDFCSADGESVMRVVRSAKSLSEASCHRWVERAIVSIREPTHTVKDRYVMFVHMPDVISPDAVFQHIRQRLLTYDIFPPRFLQAWCFPEERLAEGTTV